MQIVHSTLRSASYYEEQYLAWYNWTLKNPGRPFDPSVLAELVREQLADNPHLVDAFLRCTREWPETEEELYTHFLSPEQRETRGEHAGGFRMQHPKLGELVVDLFVDPSAPGGLSVAGIEYLDLVLDRSRK